MKILFKSVMTQRRLMRAATASVFNIQIYLFKLFCWQSPMFTIVQDAHTKFIMPGNFISSALMLSCKVEVCKILAFLKSLYTLNNSFCFIFRNFFQLMIFWVTQNRNILMFEIWIFSVSCNQNNGVLNRIFLHFILLQ